VTRRVASKGYAMEKPKAASTLPLLRFPPAEAEKKIEAHVVKGERLKRCLREGDVLSAYPEDIQEACWSWHQESRTLLRALFTTKEKADAYRVATAPAYIQGLALSPPRKRR